MLAFDALSNPAIYRNPHLIRAAARVAKLSWHDGDPSVLLTHFRDCVAKLNNG